jgi:hypothetical protein
MGSNMYSHEAGFGLPFNEALVRGGTKGIQDTQGASEVHLMIRPVYALGV